MENSLKQRLVGALVLIALAVIFLPPILKEKTQQEPFQSQIPAKPIELINTKIDESLAKKNQQLQESLDQLETKQRKRKSIDITEEGSLINKVKQTVPIQIQTEPAQVKESDKTRRVKAQEGSSVTEPKTLGKNFKDAAWVIQIASFSNQENATNFVDKLKASGHPAYKKQAKQNNKAIYRIFVGPYVDKQDAQKTLKSVNKLSPSTGMLQVYDPSKH